ncbi:TerD family protein [Streptomyces sp. SID8379]|uniref:TerD family protein n=1 Tax=unclassified Streptomyces TaxID=2593676 RepID=UPI00039D1365|nr:MULTISPECIES: TerD family protein [unclassified Streptomyces]MYW65743.1 TerD family protein [Streptomyces sp. SID8379]
MTEMSKGGNLPVPSTALHVAVVWQQGPGIPDVDVSALLLDAAGRVRGDADLVFYNQPAHPSNAVRHLGRGQDPGGTGADWIWLDLAAVEPGVERVVVAASADGETFGRIPGLAVHAAIPQGATVASFAIGDATTETAFVFGEFYRRNGSWKFRAVGQGYASGLAGLATDFGIGIEDESSAPPPAPAPFPPPMPAPPQEGPGSPAELAVAFPPFVTQGTGKQRVTCPPSLPPGCRVVVEIECRDSISVAVSACDAYGRSGETLLAAYEDEVHGRTVATVPDDRPLTLLVEADTPWQLRVLPLGHARRLDHTLHGSGADLLVYPGGPGVLSFAHQGESNFTVWHRFRSTDPDWPHDDEDLLVNEVGRLDVLAPVQGPGLLLVAADGPWQISVGG